LGNHELPRYLNHLKPRLTKEKAKRGF
jgi:hypothetical protein